MSYCKIQKLADKFADRPETIGFRPIYLGDDENIHNQRLRLEEMFHDLYQGFRSSLNEIEGDILALKVMGLDSDTLKAMGKVVHDINHLVKQLNPENPYIVINQLYAWINDRNNKSILDNLDFITKAFVKKQQNFSLSKGVGTLKVNGLSNLVNKINEAKAYADQNPLLPDPRELATVPPPGKAKKEENVPGVQDALNALKQISNR